MPKRFKLGRHRKNEHKTKGNEPTCTLTVEHVVLPQDSVTVACCTNVPTPPTPAPEPPESLVLATRLEEAIQRRGIQVDDALHRDLSTTMAEKTLEIKEKYSPGSFLNIFWEQQERACKLKNAKSMQCDQVCVHIQTYMHTYTHLLPCHPPPPPSLIT